MPLAAAGDEVAIDGSVHPAAANGGYAAAPVP